MPIKVGPIASLLESAEQVIKPRIAQILESQTPPLMRPSGSGPLHADGGAVGYAGGGDVLPWVAKYLKARLPKEFAKLPISNLGVQYDEQGTGRTAFALGDNYVAKLWNPRNPRGLTENAFTDAPLESQGLIPTKRWISPDHDISVVDRMQQDLPWRHYFIQPMQRSFEAEMKKNPAQDWTQIHVNNPRMAEHLERRGLDAFKDYDILAGDFFKPEHWMRNPSEVFNPVLVDEGSLIPDLVRTHSKPQNYSTLYPDMGDIIQGRLPYIDDNARRGFVERALAQAKEAMHDERSSDLEDMLSAADWGMSNPNAHFAGGGSVRNWLSLAKPGDLPGAIRSGYDQVMNRLRDFGGSDDVQNWLQRNFANYIKRDFGGENDKLRDLHLQGKLGFSDTATGQPRPNSQATWDEMMGNVVKDIPASRVKQHLGMLAPTGRMLDADLPAWLREQQGSGKTFSDLSHMDFIDWLHEPTGRVVDYLNSLPPAQQARLNKMSVPDAFEKAHDWHQAMAKKATDAAASMEGTTLHKEYPSGYKWVKIDGGEMPAELPDGYTLTPGKQGWWRLQTQDGVTHLPLHPEERDAAMQKALEFARNQQLKQALDAEGCAMGHCVGSYADDVASGNSTIYSLRDEKGVPHVTVEVAPAVKKGDIMPVLGGRAIMDAPADITQIRGKANQTPNPEYHPYIRDFIKSGQWGDVENPKRFGLLDLGGGPEPDQKGFTRFMTQDEIDALRGQPWPGQQFADGGMVDAPTIDDAAAQSAGHTASDGQKTAGNYQKGHAVVAGIPISIENAAGTKRRPEWPALQHHYGYIKGTTGKDKDHLDVFVKPGTPNDYDGNVHVVDQKKQGNGHFDEHKILLGFDTADEAHEAYKSNYTPGWDGVKSMSSWTMPEFKRWLAEGDHTQESVKQVDKFADGGAVDTKALATKYNRAYGLPEGLVQAVMQEESRGNNKALSPKGAIGLMQLMPKTADDLGVDPHDPEQNIEGGARYLRQMLKRFGDLRAALAAYNWGPGNVVTYGLEEMPTETRKYIGKVLERWDLDPKKAVEASSSAKAPAAARIAAPEEEGPSRGILKMLQDMLSEADEDAPEEAMA